MLLEVAYGLIYADMFEKKHLHQPVSLEFVQILVYFGSSNYIVYKRNPSKITK